MAELSPFAAATAQYGVITRAQLLEEGFSDAEIATLARRRQLHRLHRGVYALGGSPDSLRQQIVAAVLAAGGGFASHRAAAELHGLHLPPEISYVPAEITVAHGVTQLIRGVIKHRSRLLPEAHTTALADVPLLTVARTVCDLASQVSEAGMARVIDDALTRRQVTIDNLAGVFQTVDKGRRGGRAVLGALISSRLSGGGIPESELEIRFLALVRHAGLPRPELQASPAWLPVRRGRVDFLYADARLVIEVDGSGHLTETQKDVDTRRDHAATLHGWAVLRFTWRQVVHDAGYVIETVRGVLARRSTSAPEPG